MAERKWFVYDPAPELPDEEPGPIGSGPFNTRQAAAEYANLDHPDDESGAARVLPFVVVDEDMRG